VNAHGLIYIVYFRLKLIWWSHEEESGPPCRQDGWPYGLPCSFLVKLNIDFFFLSCWLSQINNPLNNWVCLTSKRFLKLKNTQNHEFLFCRVNPKIKGT
jgi:hypothetical protein